VSLQENAGAPGSVRSGKTGAAATPYNAGIVNYIIARADIRSSPGGDKLSVEAAHLFAVLISMDPEVQTPPDFQFYVQRHGVKQFPPYTETRSLPQLQRDLNTAHDNLKKQVHINTRINTQLTKTETALRWERIWRRILTAAIVVQFTIIGWLITEFLHRIAN
jgi:hypothetical protein